MVKYYVGNTRYYEFSSNEKEYKNYKYWIIEYTNENNIYHRLDGPAREYSNGNKFWYKNGDLHREDGPAKDLPKIKYYFYNDEEINVSTDKEFKKYLKMKVFK
jgi:hypothetical protein